MFFNRQEAGQLLAQKLLSDKTGRVLDSALILAVPRGGVVVAAEIAQAFKCNLDIIVTRKISAPNNQELAIGAVGETNGSRYLNQKLITDLEISQAYLEEEEEKQKLEIKRRESIYRQGRQAYIIKDRMVVIVDDGAATGATLIASVREVWNNKPKRVMIALPVAPAETVVKLEKEADEVTVLEEPEPFFSVGQFYRQFSQVSDAEVIEILNKFKK